MTTYLDPRTNSIFSGKQVRYDKMPLSNPEQVQNKIATLSMEVDTAESLIPMGFVASCGVRIDERLKVLNQAIGDLQHLFRTMNNPKKARRN